MEDAFNCLYVYVTSAGPSYFQCSGMQGDRPPFSHTPGLQPTLKHFSASEIGGVIEIPVPYMSVKT